MSNRLLSIGLAGTLLTGLCAFTPMLVWILIAVCLGEFAQNWLNLVLFPILALFVCLTVYALLNRGSSGATAQGKKKRKR